MNPVKLLAAAMVFAGVAHAAEAPVTSYELTLVDMQGQKKVLATLPGSVFVVDRRQGGDGDGRGGPPRDQR